MSNYVSHYRLIKELGKGGMGIAYLAEDPLIGEKVAIKRIHPIFFLEPQSLERFKEESYIVSSLSHPNIIKVFEIGEEDGKPFVVMEYMDGGSISDLVSYGPIPFSQVLNILTSILKGIYYAHSLGVYHADMKTSNILFKRNGEVKISDFGMGALVVSLSDVTGTPAYMAPEVILEKRVDARTDIYSLGVVLYEMVTGRLPFTGDTAYDVMQKHIKEEPHKPSLFIPNIPPILEQVILKAMYKDNNLRYQSIEEMAKDLEVLIYSMEEDAFTPGTIIHLDTKPERAEVYLDDGFCGYTPIKINGNFSGKGKMIIKKPRYISKEIELNFTPFSTLVLNLKLMSESLPLCRIELKKEPITPLSMVESSIFIGTRTRELLELDSFTGELMVCLPLEKEIVGNICYGDGYIFMTTKDGNLLGLKAGSYSPLLDNSSLIFEIPLGGDPINGAFSNLGKVYAATRQGVLYGFKVDTGNLLFKLQHISSVNNVLLSPDEIIYLASQEGLIVAVDTIRGETIWSFKVPQPVFSPPLLYGEKLFVVSQGGIIYGLSPSKGDILLWNNIEKNIKSSLEIFDDVLYLPANDGVVYAFDIRKQEIIWERLLIPRPHSPDKLFLSTIGFDELVHLISTNGIWYKLNKINGDLINETNLGSKFEVSPVQRDKIIYLVDTKGTFFALPLD